MEVGGAGRGASRLPPLRAAPAVGVGLAAALPGGAVAVEGAVPVDGAAVPVLGVAFARPEFGPAGGVGAAPAVLGAAEAVVGAPAVVGVVGLPRPEDVAVAARSTDQIGPRTAAEVGSRPRSAVAGSLVPFPVVGSADGAVQLL